MITWTCHICKKLRNDNEIAVHTEDISLINGVRTGIITQNIRYCIDNPECEKSAKNFNLFKNKLKGLT